MQQDSLGRQSAESKIGVYECEVHLKFRMVEDQDIFNDRDNLLERLLEAFSYGADEYLEPLLVQVNTQAVSELQASPKMRRQLIRLRNISE